MTAENQNFSIYAGDSKIIRIFVLDEDNGNQPYNLTGVNINWVLYDPVNDVILITKTTSSGINIPDPTTGIFEVSLLPSDTENIKPAEGYIHEAEITDTFGNVITITTGFVHIKKSRA